ncbi:SDR family NAD(P)-dependent oxidoreductase [Roseibium aggregatum]|uniref:SDR family oxidoreductase n=1 Tax=Roseibium aggregatum TaxID=187304 RepID=A0A926S4F7_9HYPH|nr:SDR family NAD(P)-dependent oxidoreductase [Roseibium aggregatum]MBD1546338.1 SDR family oxidoreductase [Roseibium aggregatum]
MAERIYNGKTLLITGAASGFGARAAERFAEEGANLILWDKASEALAEKSRSFAETGSKVLTATVDVTSEDQVRGAMAMAKAKFGTLDIAINNAGIGHEMAPLPSIDAATFDRVMAVNAKGVFLCMKHQLPWMKEAGQGAILNVASAAGLVGAGMLSAYAASKHAVIGLTKSAADEVARKNIRVNALCPSFAVTPLFDDMADEVADRHGMDREDAYDRITQRIPMHRVATVDEVVQAMLWICSPENSFMTGQAVSIDGGLTAV